MFLLAIFCEKRRYRERTSTETEVETYVKERISGDDDLIFFLNMSVRTMTSRVLTDINEATAHMLVKRPVFTANTIWEPQTFSIDIHPKKNVRGGTKRTHQFIYHSVRPASRRWVSDTESQEKKRGQLNRWKPVLDLCNTIHNTAAMRTSPTAARALTVMDRPFESETQYVSRRMSDDSGGGLTLRAPSCLNVSNRKLKWCSNVFQMGRWWGRTGDLRLGDVC